MPKIKPTKIIVIAVCIAIIAAVAWTFFKPKEQTQQYITAEVTRGDLESTVLATGNLQATKMVSVGAQVSGQVKKMYVKLGDQVKQGQLIAQIDSVTQQNEFKKAEANIKNQKAQLAVKQANLAKMTAEYNRQKNMFAQDATSRADYDNALAAFKTAEADITAMNALIEQSYLSMATTKENLGYTSIVAPMDGTIVAIVTEEGQTVNANQSAPTIVKLAQLGTMTINSQISEADVMKVHAGQKVYFTTLGDSEKKHYASLRQVEPAPTSINTESNNSSNNSASNTAIYYNALFDVPNEDGKLRIDMTAQVYIILADAKNVLMIPSASLQSSNRAPRAANPNAAANKSGAANSGAASGARTDKNATAADRPIRLELTAAEKAMVDQGLASLSMVRVLQEDGTAQRVQVLVGLNNRINAQILRGLKQGQQVIIADGSDTSNNSAKRNPSGMRI